jgi:hypothetical protein
MRAVSFFGPGTGGAFAGAGGTGVGALNAEEGGDGTPPGGEPPLAGGGGAGREKSGGSTRLAGAGGRGVCARGGRGGAGEPGVVEPGGGAAGGRGAASFDGGRVGKLIRVVSRPPLPVAGGSFGGSGGSVIRTVSFLGSLGSAIKSRELV